MARLWLPRRRAITASGTTLPPGKTQMQMRPDPEVEVIQTRAWRSYRTIGEVRFVARYMGNSMARTRFFVGQRDNPAAPITEIDDTATGDDQTAREQLQRIRGRDGTFASLVRTYGV